MQPLVFSRLGPKIEVEIRRRSHAFLQRNNNRAAVLRNWGDEFPPSQDRPINRRSMPVSENSISLAGFQLTDSIPSESYLARIPFCSRAPAVLY